MKKGTKIKYKELLKHETKLNVLIKFSIVTTIFIAYLVFISLKYGGEQGFHIAILTWSFFVLCTPIADAGFLIDFPLRLVTKIRMFKAEMFVWLIAISINLFTFIFNQEIYTKTNLLTLFKHILDKPFPFWIIILISMAGTFISIKFGDELLDKTKHKHVVKKHKTSYKLIFMVFLIVMSLVLYNFLLKGLGIKLPI